MLKYVRQTILPELGIEGQRRLHSGSVLCMGIGGLGSPSLLYLAAAGIGKIGLVDDDTVDVSNLQRQILFKESHQGQPKVDAAKVALEALNSECRIDIYRERFNANNAQRLLADYDVVLDGTDNFSSKFLINDACMKFNKPLIYASILGFTAQVAVFWAEHGACYRCLYPTPPSGHVPNCAEAGVIGAMAGIAGATQALEAIKMLLGLQWCQEKGLEPLLSKLWLLEARSMETQLLNIHKRPTCFVCARKPEDIILQNLPEICGGAANAVVKHLTPEEARKLLGRTVFIDVRETHELASGKIPGARHIPLGTLLKDEDAVGDLDLDTPMVVYCQHGVRSVSAATHLITLGFTNIAHVKGGIAQWNGKLA